MSAHKVRTRLVEQDGDPQLLCHALQSRRKVCDRTKYGQLRMVRGANSARDGPSVRDSDPRTKVGEWVTWLTRGPLKLSSNIQRSKTSTERPVRWWQRQSPEPHCRIPLKVSNRAAVLHDIVGHYAQ